VKGKILYVLYVALVVLVLLMAVEGLGRAWVHFRYGVPGKSYGIWAYDPVLGADHRPNSYNSRTSLNAQACRNTEDMFEPKPQGSLRILAVGGSTTFGYNLNDASTWTHQLELRLRRLPGHERDQVLNAGRICWSAGHNLVYLKRILSKINPDYVILYEGVNEQMNVWGLLQEGVKLDDLDKLGSYGVLTKRYDQNRWLKRNSVIVRYYDYVIKRYIQELRNKQASKARTAPVSAVPQGWIIKNFHHLMSEMIDVCRANNARIIVIRYASTVNQDLSVFADIAAEEARAKNVPVFDAKERFSRFGEHMPDYFIETGVHVTPEGAMIMADELLDILLKDLGSRGQA